MIVITTPALHTPKKWPGFMERARQEAVAPVINMKKFDGTLIGSFPIGDPNDLSLAIYRSKLHNVLFEYAFQLGIPVEFSATASEFFEADSHGGVVLSDGRTITADVVVAADGVGSRSWELVVGSKEPPISSGFVLYRVTFPVAPALENPVIAKQFEGFKDRAFLHAGSGAHMVTCKSAKDICWLLTRRVRFRTRRNLRRLMHLISRRRTTVRQKKTGRRARRSTKPSKPSRAGNHSLPSLSMRHPTAPFFSGSSCGVTLSRSGPHLAAASSRSVMPHIHFCRPRLAAGLWPWRMPIPWPLVCILLGRRTCLSQRRCITT